MERDQQRKIVEALVMGAREPVSAARLAEVVPNATPATVRELVGELGEQYEASERSFEIWEVAGGYQIRTRPSYAPYLRQLHKERPLRLSRAALETLALVAYKQPVTRAEIEHVRGVDAGAVLRSLLERSLVRVAGHREVPGKPVLYGTSRRFLEVFGLERLEDLPTLRQIDEIVGETQPGGALAPGGAPPEDEAEADDGEAARASEGEDEGEEASAAGTAEEGAEPFEAELDPEAARPDPGELH